MATATQPVRYILFDTNIFQHLGNTELAENILKVLTEVYSLGYRFAMSQFSIIELVDNATVETEQKRLDAIKGIKHLKVKQNILITAAHLGSLYKNDGLDEKQQPEKGDKIIAATAIIYNCIIYTTNPIDFPQPYFREVSRHTLAYKKNGRDVTIMGYFMEPDLEATAARYNERIKSETGDYLVSRTEKTENI